MNLNRRELLAAAASAGLMAAAATTKSTGTVVNHSGFTADRVLDSIGVNVHVRYDDEVYGAQWQLMLSQLQELGVKHVRDGILPSSSYKVGAYVAQYLDDLRAAGIKQNLTLGNPGGKYGEYNTSQYPTCIADLKSTLYAGSFDSLEGPNEQDIYGTGSNWVTTTKDFMAKYYPALKADSTLKDFPVLSPSIGHPKTDSTAYGTDHNNDAGNMHTYSGVNYPESSTAALPSMIDWQTNIVGTGKPVYATEFGWQMATGLSWHVDAQTQSDYLIRAFLNNLRHGVYRSFMYELYDSKPDSATGSAQTDPEKHFGLYYVTGSGTGTTAAKTWTTSIKPSGQALTRLLQRMKDSSTGTAPYYVQYGLGPVPSDVTSFPIMRHDGSFDIAMWRALPLWKSGQRYNPPVVPVNLSLPTARPVRTFKPSDGVTNTLSSSTTNVTVPVDGQVTLVLVG